MSARVHSRRSRSPRFEPPLDDWPPAGVYQLWLRVSVVIRVRVGRLGRCEFPPGRYVYTGRAGCGLPARVRRHVRRRTVRQWHIDYLLGRREVRLERATLASRRPADECPVNQATGGRVIVPGFGSSDCHVGCGAHLLLVSGRCFGDNSS